MRVERQHTWGALLILGGKERKYGFNKSYSLVTKRYNKLQSLSRKIKLKIINIQGVIKIQIINNDCIYMVIKKILATLSVTLNLSQGFFIILS